MYLYKSLLVVHIKIIYYDFISTAVSRAYTFISQNLKDAHFSKQYALFFQVFTQQFSHHILQVCLADGRDLIVCINKKHNYQEEE